MFGVRELKEEMLRRNADQNSRIQASFAEIATRIMCLEKYLGLEFVPTQTEVKHESPKYTKKQKKAEVK